jgi:hypothetical protein
MFQNQLDVIQPNMTSCNVEGQQQQGATARGAFSTGDERNVSTRLSGIERPTRNVRRRPSGDGVHKF